MSSADASWLQPSRPPVDHRLVAPGSRYEIYEGILVYVAPADELQGRARSRISALAEAHAGSAFDVACDMLIRCSETTDIAPDVSVFPIARDSRTRGQQLTHLAFEVVNTQLLGYASHKAAALAARGVRRVFGIDIERGRAMEWSKPLGRWQALDSGEHIADPALAAPLPISALIDTNRTDDAIARALIIKRNPIVEEYRARSRAEGKREGFAEAIILKLVARGIVLSTADRMRILEQRDLAILVDWARRSATCRDALQLVGSA